MQQEQTTQDRIAATFEHKVRWAKLALVFEQVWLKLWLLIALAGLFVLLSFLGVWPAIGATAHKVLLALFALALAAWIAHAARIEWPSRDDAVRRIEKVSGVPHRPATSYEDTLTASSSDPATLAIWQAHRARMAVMLSRLKPGAPQPRTDRHDPFALRALLMLSVVLGVALTGGSALDRLKAAFQFAPDARLANARLDAWVAPPGYTGLAPVMLADGANALSKLAETAVAGDGKPVEVPEKSVIIVRSSGLPDQSLSLEVTEAGSKTPVTLQADTTRKLAGDVAEIRHELNNTSVLKVRAGGEMLAQWPISVIPDRLPSIELTKDPQSTSRGSLKLTYKAEDDYGLAGAEVNLQRVKPMPRDPAKDWAKPEELTGPRPPLRRPPTLTLRLPQANAKKAEAFTHLEMGSHPWSGQRVLMTLEIKDVAGKIGRSATREIVLPQRRFTKPLALAVVEQRRKLLEDPRNRDRVITALDAFTVKPEGFLDDSRVYLGLRTAAHRLGRDGTRAGMDDTIDQLWNIALRIEDGDLSDAERALREAQEKLAKALEDGASDEEIQKLMKELKQAFNEYAKQLAKENQDNAEQSEGQDPNSETMSQEDLDRMMQEMEDMAKNGSREQAMEMLAEMRDMMERMQSAKQNPQQVQKNQEAQKMMRKLGEAVGEQQDIMDDTFQERRKGGGKSEMKQKGKGSKGQRGEGMQADNGESGETGQGGQEGQESQGGQGGQQGQQGKGGKSLADRQRALREKLESLQRELREKGTGSGDQLDEAAEAMKEAEDALKEGELSDANDAQGRALEKMRQESQAMAQEMAKNSPQRYGQSGDAPRDPLGRPQKTQGPDLGTSVRVPDQIDMQRAREILEELRRRVGEAQRPPIELDYLERLLRRF